MQAGDRVVYVPHSCHLSSKHPATGQYAWVFGIKHGWLETDSQGNPVVKEYVEELTTARTDHIFEYIRRSQEPDKAWKQLLKLRYNKGWPAKVARVHEDGTVDIDIQGHNGGVTLHYRKVSVVSHSSNPPHHSCHRELIG